MDLKKIVSHWFPLDRVAKIEPLGRNAVWRVVLSDFRNFYLKCVTNIDEKSILWEKDLLVCLRETGFTVDLPLFLPCINGKWLYTDSSDASFYMMSEVPGKEITRGKEIGILLAEYHNHARYITMPKRKPGFTYCLLRSLLPAGWDWKDLIGAYADMPVDCTKKANKLIGRCKELDNLPGESYLLPVHGDWMACNLCESPYGILDFECAEWDDVCVDVAKMLDNAYSSSKCVYDAAMACTLLDGYFSTTTLPLSVYKRLDSFIQRRILGGFVYEASHVFLSADVAADKAVFWAERQYAQYEAAVGLMPHIAGCLV